MYTKKQLNDANVQELTLKTLKKLADTNYKSDVVKHIEDGGFDVRVALRSIAIDISPKRYLEVGVGVGWSFAQVLDACKAHCVGVDKFVPRYAGWVYNKTTVENELKQFGDNFEIIAGDSRQVLPELTDSFELIFVDGGHTDAVAKFDLYASAELLADGGVLVFDDLIEGNEGGDYTMLQIWQQFKEDFSDWEFAEFEDALTPFGIAIKPASKSAKKVVNESGESSEPSKATPSTTTKKKTRRSKK